MRCKLSLALSLALMVALSPAGALGQAASEPSTAAELPLFAIEIRVGPKWDASKPPQDQAYFREHSTHLRRLRESGSLVMGARYSDKGLVVVAAGNLAEARALMDQDPSIAAGTFAFDVHPFNVFYPGELKLRPRR